MPSFEFVCSSCQCEFDDYRTIADRDAAGECPDCGSSKIRRVMRTPPRVEGDIADWSNDPGGKGRYCPQAARFPKDPKAYFKDRNSLSEWGKRKGYSVSKSD
jgi:putative FmdB family regulatory protein